MGEKERDLMFIKIFKINMKKNLFNRLLAGKEAYMMKPHFKSHPNKHNT